jgi:hypothetical protein
MRRGLPSSIAVASPQKLRWFSRSSALAKIEIDETELNIREKLAHIDQMLADRDRERQGIRLAPWQLILAGTATGVGLLVATAALIKLLA